jgi:hypothetical protein
MPAPQSSQMKQLAKAKFAGFNIKVPTGWSDPSGQDGDHYGRAFKQEDHSSSPVAGQALFQPNTMFKWQTDVQKAMHSGFSDYLDGICDAICQAWSTWQSAAMFTGIVLAPGGMATVGVLAAPGVDMGKLVLAQGPKSKASTAKFTKAIADTLSTNWAAWCLSVKLTGAPLWAAAMAPPLPTPMAPAPLPSISMPFKSCAAGMDMLVSTQTLKGLMVTNLGDPQAPHADKLFEAVANAFETCHTQWQGTTMFSNGMTIITAGPGTPIVPAPLLSGTAMMPPGGLT